MKKPLSAKPIRTTRLGALKARLALFVLCVMPLFALAQERAAEETAASDKVAEIEGVYKEKRLYEIVGETEPKELEDIIEIVRLNTNSIYVRALLFFSNAHSCGIHGIATYENNAFVYRKKEPSEGENPSCTLTVWAEGKYLNMTDTLSPDGDSTCRSYCGQRGTLSYYSIETSRKRKIRYMDRLLNSRQYAEAVAEYNE